MYFKIFGYVPEIGRYLPLFFGILSIPFIGILSYQVKKDNSFLLAYHARAYLYELSNRSERAKLDWKNCLMLNPSYIPALEGLNK